MSFPNRLHFDNLSEKVLEGRKGPGDEVIGGDGVTAWAGAGGGYGTQSSATTGGSSHRLWLKSWTIRHDVQMEGSTPRPQLGRLYWLIIFSARSLIWNLLPLGQVHWSGRAIPEQGLSRYSMENGMLSPLVHWHVDGGTPSHGFKLLLKILPCITGLFKMFRNPPAPPISPPILWSKSFWGAARAPEMMHRRVRDKLLFILVAWSSLDRMMWAPGFLYLFFIPASVNKSSSSDVSKWSCQTAYHSSAAFIVIGLQDTFSTLLNTSQWI